MIKSLKKLKFNLSLTKREKIITAAIILALGLLSTGFMPLAFYLAFKIHLIIGFVILASALSVWILFDGLTLQKALVLIILPALFTLATSSYYFLLPVRWLTRLPVALVFGGIWYSLLLSQNVFNISATRTIPLYRVASTVVFVLTITTASLLFNVLFSLHLFFLWNGLLVFGLCFLLILQILWEIEMEEVNLLIIVTSLILALVLGEMAIALSFWPLSNALISVLLTAALYLNLGISTDYLRGRLTKEVVLGYLKWAAPIFILVYLITSWGS